MKSKQEKTERKESKSPIRKKVYKRWGKKRVTQEFLRKTFEYNPETGEWKWNIKFISRGRLSKRYGKRVGCISPSNGYWYISIGNRTYQSSRLAFLYMEGYLPENQVDHINRIRHDDRWCNLRHVSASCNNRNVLTRKTNTSGITGVCYHKTEKKWVCFIHNNGTRIYKSYKEFDAAVMCRWELEKKYQYPNCNTTSDAYRYLLSKGLI